MPQEVHEARRFLGGTAQGIGIDGAAAGEGATPGDPAGAQSSHRRRTHDATVALATDGSAQQGEGLGHADAAQGPRPGPVGVHTQGEQERQEPQPLPAGVAPRRPQGVLQGARMAAALGPAGGDGVRATGGAWGGRQA